ncbi:unnamed protein product [Vitrella brassicaformis CCMP3155]|uniref:Uncharacterized protein n=2 Tax=Vitrella brassicaformis TaxID=1169539 RepID=A0A0G4FBF2_VITBC|nr:unnamed protein product [Vitrella brassicaformis CCMP3155]|eukprot:CEM10289.1 unnamed protein product [Vitrella brassicaformis CCMP3155]
MTALQLRALRGIGKAYGTLPDWVFDVTDLSYVELCTVTERLGEGGELEDDDRKAFEATVVRMSCQIRRLQLWKAELLRGRQFKEYLDSKLPKPPHYPYILERPPADAIEICEGAAGSPGQGQVKNTQGS